jgi:hypothetical protein
MVHFFNGDPFVQQRINQQTNNTTTQLEHNIIVLEIVNNWEIVKDLFNRIEKGEVDLLNQLESTWVQFFSNKSSIDTFEGPEDFEVKLLKPLV